MFLLDLYAGLKRCLPERLRRRARLSRRSTGRILKLQVRSSSLRLEVAMAAVTTGSVYCAKCIPDVNRENLLRQAKLGQIATHSAIAEARRSATQARQAKALRKWDPSTIPHWLDEDFYRKEILPRLFTLTVKRLRLAIDVSHPYATLIKRGDKIPHPRHWLALAKLADIIGSD